MPNAPGNSWSVICWFGLCKLVKDENVDIYELLDFSWNQSQNQRTESQFATQVMTFSSENSGPTVPDPALYILGRALNWPWRGFP